MSLHITGTLAGAPTVCDSRTDLQCELDPGSAFTVEIVPDTIPAGGYGFWQAALEYGALTYKARASASDEITWDLGILPLRAPQSPIGNEGQVSFGDLSSFFELYPLSFQMSTLVTLDFNCTASDTLAMFTMDTSPDGSLYGGNAHRIIVIPAVGSMQVDCGPPTPTITPGGPTLTPPPIPSATPGGPAMSLLISGTVSGSPALCDSNVVVKCTLDAGTSFTVAIIPKSIPPGGYGFWQTLVSYGDLQYKPGPIGGGTNDGGEMTWDLSFLPLRAPANPIGNEGEVGHANVSGFFEPYDLSTQQTALVTLEMNCTSSDTLRLINFDERPDGAVYGGESGEIITIPVVGSLQINCVGPTPVPPTATPTPCTINGQLDSDCDLMPDKFENASVCLNPFLADGNLDPDKDGLANVKEYGIGTNPCNSDTDGDSHPDGSDGCRLSAEDFDGFEDADGCPEYDNDLDGICDGHFAPAPIGPIACSIPDLPGPRYVPAYPGGPAPDRCPNVPEDYDGFKDLDGCPDPDNDNDGHPDGSDDCPGTDYTAGPDGIADSGDEPLDAFGVPLRTREDYDGVIDNDGCHDSPGDDYDHDGIPDSAEVFVYGSDPTDPDTDNDGCLDGREVGSQAALGGLRDPTDFWDFFDTPNAGNIRDKIISVLDVFALGQRFGANDAEGLAAINRTTDPLSFPPPAPAYHPAFDRGSRTGLYPWNSAPPDGTINLVNDILGMVFQFGHSCA